MLKETISHRFGESANDAPKKKARAEMPWPVDSNLPKG
jgi:hypothetical protein